MMMITLHFESLLLVVAVGREHRCRRGVTRSLRLFLLILSSDPCSRGVV